MNFFVINTKILKNIIKVGISLLFLLPLLLTSNILYPFIFSKVIFFQIIIELLIPVYLLYIFAKPQHRPQLNWLNISVGLFMLALAVSTIFSVDPAHSFWGATEWHNGLFLYLHLFCLFLMVQIFRKKSDWRCFFRVVLISGLIVVASALLQKAGLIFASKPRLVGLIGNASFLATYLLFVIYSSVWLLFKEKNLHFKIFIGFGTFLSALVLIMTESRSAILALSVSLLACLVVYILFYASKKVRKYWIAGVVLMAIVVTIFLNYNFSRYDQDWTRTRNIQTRLISWNITWQAWQSKFFLGWGLENFYVAFNQHFDPEYLTWSVSGGMNYEAALNFAHNKVLDIGLSAGIFGLLFYLMIYVAAIYYLYKNKQNKANFIVWTGFLTAHFINNLFLFDFILTFIGFFVILGLVASQNSNLKKIEIKKVNVLKILIVILLSIIMLVLVYKVNFQSFKCAKLTNQAWQYEQQKQYELMIETYRQALSMNSFVIEKTLEYSEIVTAQLISNNFENKKIVDYYLFELQASQDYVEKHPHRLNALLQLGELYNAGRDYDFNNVNKAVQVFEQAIQIAPNRPEPYIHLAQSYIYLEDKQLAIENFQKAVDLNPEFYISSLILGHAYKLWDNEDLMIEQYQQAVDSGYNGTKELNVLAKYYEKEQKYSQALEIYSILSQKYPEKVLFSQKVDEMSKLLED